MPGRRRCRAEPPDGVGMQRRGQASAEVLEHEQSEDHPGVEQEQDAVTDVGVRLLGKEAGTLAGGEEVLDLLPQEVLPRDRT